MRDDKLYLDDILSSIRRIEEYTQAGEQSFLKSTLTQDAVIRNFEIIGEASKQISQALRERYPDLPWRRMAGFRDVLIHGYMRVRLDLIWRTVEDEIPTLRPQIEAILEKLDREEP